MVSALRIFKPFFLVILVLCLFAITACKDNKSKIIPYPKNFPQECIDYLDKWMRYIEKAKASNRFDKEAIAAFQSHREAVQYILDKEYRDNEERRDYCKMEEIHWTFFDPIDNMHNMTQAELEKAIDVEYDKKRHRERGSRYQY
ncbi:hypothetical protein AXE65_07995 [Ventosimonas gracilis]|uniref:Uncharacterized protein n=1 Tax=Ventosimonas gracilis TaxID=1680762 RepID=A0A139SHD5_9GAMM|nr:hypothetical protein [Ventosimonas gracilis]KXU33953.1 hypothetical protein AXE65_07995 [Ventosimonas gracilis]